MTVRLTVSLIQAEVKWDEPKSLPAFMSNHVMAFVTEVLVIRLVRRVDMFLCVCVCSKRVFCSGSSSSSGTPAEAHAHWGKVI